MSKIFDHVCVSVTADPLTPAEAYEGVATYRKSMEEEIHETLVTYETEGWELVSVVAHNQNFIRLFFKRPV